ncbi:MAG: RnfABCDGE type electron transport complex subunit B [Ruminococcus sp.]|jgi:Na+-translocating ferredoxin:NAD+ oxidoreductase RNF subunit RnfB|nr:RnfABCDGE type electron transport complex subunit B [Ruminococcus sp.]
MLLPIIVFSVLALLVGILLTVFSKIFAVKTDETAAAVLEALPGVNCGACGYAGCSDYANAVAQSGAPVNLCKPGGNESAALIASIMGVTAESVTPQVAVVHCSGDCRFTARKFEYKGVQSCVAADRFYSGSESCSYGCLAYGDCAKVCPEMAISITDELAKVDKTRCIGCGLCVRTCPGGIIKLRDVGKRVDVLCSSKDPGKMVRAVCKTGCIGCKICEKKCPEGAISVTDNLAAIDYDKCTGCKICAEKCPSKVIKECSTEIRGQM